MEKMPTMVTLLTAEQVEAMFDKNFQKALQPNFFSIPEEDELLTREETARILKITLPTLHAYTKSGKITGYRVGTRVRYKKSEVSLSLQKIKTAS